MSRKKIDFKKTILVILFFVIIVLLVILAFNSKTMFKEPENLYSIKVRGYELDNIFDMDRYEYNVVVSEEIVEISCDTDIEIEGCNVSIDLTDKENYIHKISVFDGQKTNTYIINIQKESTSIEENNTNDAENNDKNETNKSKFYVKSVNGNTFNWTNKDITLEVLMSEDGKYLYSFDGGTTWQESNKLVVKNNSNFQLIVKNDKGEMTEIKNIEVDRIDKESPQVTINKSSINSSKVILEASYYDNLSGVESVSFNGSSFTSNTKYNVTTPGKYYFQVKDRAGNISEKQYIEVTKIDFKQETNTNEPKKTKTYRVTLKENGASVGKSSISCTTTEDSCQVILPNIETKHTVVGWALNSDSTSATYTEGQTISINRNMTLYAITKKTYTATFNQNGATSVGATSKSCTAYNSNKCEITTPNITRTGGTAVGWSTNSGATTAKVGVNEKIELTSNSTYYAITKRTYTAQFNQNGATSIGATSKSCTAYNSNKCEITTPNITRTGGTAVGWSTNSGATTATIGTNKKIELANNVTYYAITKRTYTATFDSSKLNSAIAAKSCTVYNTNTSCSIVLPEFNRTGYFNEFWSTESAASSNLRGKTWGWNHVNQVGHSYTLTGNITFYPNFNHFHYDLDKNYYKYRSLSISTSRTIGKTIFEFESGIPQSAINTFISSMTTAYNTFPWLFSSGKIFVMKESTYNNYSIAYGLTHAMYSAYGGDSHFTIDLKYDTSGIVVKNAIDVNAALHELAHAWDSHYNFRKGNGQISSLSDFNTFYNSISSKLYTDDSGEKISKVETFAGMFTNYYWHVLGKDTSKSYYALKSNTTLSSAELQRLKTFMEKYINIAKNGY